MKIKSLFLIWMLLLYPAALSWAELCDATPEMDWTLPTTDPNLGPPTLITPDHLATVYISQPVYLSWSEVPGATGYNLNVQTLGCWINKVVTEPFFEIPAGELFAQGYPWAVRAMGGGKIGPKSTEYRVFNVFENTPTPTPTVYPTQTPDIDITENGEIDWEDTFLILSEWYLSDATHDLVGDSRFTHRDLIAYLKAWRGREGVPLPPLLPPPILLEPEDGVDVSRDRILRVGETKVGEGVLFKWLPVGTADGYYLRFIGPPGGTLGTYRLPEPIRDTEVLVTLPITTLINDLGTYSWQVLSLNTELEKAGPYGDPRTFKVVNPIPTATPEPTPLPRTADVNQDGFVTIDDIFTLASAWKIRSGSPGFLSGADLDQSGKVEENDLYRFIDSHNRRSEENIQSPMLYNPENGAIVTLADIMNGSFEWSFSAVQGAALYHYEVYGPPQFPFADGMIQDTGESWYDLGEEAGISPASLGEWSWRLRAYNSAGRMSPWSEMRSFSFSYVRPTPRPKAKPQITPTPTPTPPD